MKQSTTIGTTLACAQAIQLRSKAEFIPIPDIPSFDIPYVSDIPDVFDEGIDYIDTGLTELGDIAMTGIDMTIDLGEDIGTSMYEDFLVPAGETNLMLLEDLAYLGATSVLITYD